MDDRKIRKVLRDAMGNRQAKIGQGVLSELRSAPIDLFDSLPEHEKSIATTAFMAAAAATQYASDQLSTPQERSEAFVTPTLGEDRTRAGLMAAAAALNRIPENQRSVSLTKILDRCHCNPIPDLA